MEIFGFLAAVLGVITAIINRKRIVVLRYEVTTSTLSGKPRSPVTVGKRFKRFLLCVALGFSFAFLLAIIAVALDTETKTIGFAFDILVWPFMFCMLLAAYQFVAMIILIFARLWR